MNLLNMIIFYFTTSYGILNIFLKHHINISLKKEKKNIYIYIKISVTHQIISKILTS